MRKLVLVLVMVAGGLITGCVTDDIATNSSAPEEPKAASIPEEPKLASIPDAKWEGRTLYDFFYDVFVEGMPTSTLEKEIFVPRARGKKGVSWEIIQASRGMNVVGIDVPKFTHLKSWDRADAQARWKAKIPFPVDEAVFVVNPHLGVTYLKGQQFKQPVIFYGYTEGFVEYEWGETNEIKQLVFLTAQGVDEMVEMADEE